MQHLYDANVVALLPSEVETVPRCNIFAILGQGLKLQHQSGFTPTPSLHQPLVKVWPFQGSSELISITVTVSFLFAECSYGKELPSKTCKDFRQLQLHDLMVFKLQCYDFEKPGRQQAWQSHRKHTVHKTCSTLSLYHCSKGPCGGV